MVERKSISRVVGIFLVVAGVLSTSIVWRFQASLAQRISTTLIACALVIAGYQMSEAGRPRRLVLIVIAALCVVAGVIIGTVGVVRQLG